MSKTPATPAPRRRTAAATNQIWQARWFHLTMWVVLFVLALVFLDAVKPILLPFVLGALIAYLMDPIADHMGRWHINRGLSAAFLTVTIFTVVIGTLAWLGPLLYHQGVDLVARIPTLIREADMALRDDTAPLFKTINRLSDGSVDNMPSSIGDLLQHAVSATGAVIAGMLASAAGVLNVLALLLITPIVCFYFIRDWPGVLEKADALLPRVYAPTIHEQLHRINQTLNAYLRGQLTVMLILAVFYAIIFSILTIKYAILLGLLAGLLVIIPYIGTWISVALGLIVAYGQFGTTTPFWVMTGVYAFGQVIESQVLTPRIVGGQVGVHPLWLLFGMLAGGVLLGFVGVLLAVPLTAVISVLVKFILERYLHSSLYTDA